MATTKATTAKAEEVAVKPTGIHQKILEIRKRVPVLSKNGVGPQAQGSYKFLSIDDILAAVVPLENEVGVISYLAGSDMVFHYNRATDKGDGRVPKENVQGFGNFVFRFVDVEDGSFIDVDVPAEGIDSQDKATRKTVTQAQKIAKITTYDLITGEPDPDAQDGGADSQNVGAASSPTRNAAQSKIEKARQPVKSGAKTDATDWKAKVIKEFLEPGKITRDELNEMVDEFKSADDPVKAVYDSLVAQGK